jgi:hypothetical protein
MTKECTEFVIPDFREAESPESIFAEISERVAELELQARWLWIPGSRLRRAPE